MIDGTHIGVYSTKFFERNPLLLQHFIKNKIVQRKKCLFVISKDIGTQRARKLKKVQAKKLV